MNLNNLGILNQINDNLLFDNKVLSKNLYGKFFVRSTLLDNKKVYVIDNNFNQFNIQTLECEKFFFHKKKLLGHSFYAKNFTYIHKLNNFLLFKSFLMNYSISQKSLLSSFTNALKFISKKQQSSFFLLNPVKGGFNCYSSGFLAFMPRKHCRFIWNYFLQYIAKKTNQFTQRKTIIPLLKVLIYKNTNNKKCLAFRLPYFLGKLNLYSSFKLNNFSNVKKKKKRKKVLAGLNFVFLSNKSKKKETKKIED